MLFATVVRASRRPLAAAVAAAMSASAFVALSSGPVSAHPSEPAARSTTFRWSGADEIATQNADWSDPANWAGGVAPAPGQRVKLVFPALACAHDGTCGRSVNDVPGLVATSLTVESLPFLQSQSTFLSYTLDGEPLSLAGPLRAKVTGATDYPVPIYLALPISSVGARRWTVDAVTLEVQAPLHGARLAVVESRGGGFQNNVDYGDSTVGDVEVRRFLVRGDGTTNDDINEPLNYTNQRPVEFRDTTVALAGASTGPLKTPRATVHVYGGGSPSETPVSVAGPVVLDRASLLLATTFRGTWPGEPGQLPGSDYPQLNATGSITLDRAGFLPEVDCDIPLDVPLPFLTARQVRGFLTDQSGQRIADGQVIAAAPGGNCPGEGPMARIDYHAGSVTLTVVSTPTSTR